MVWFTFPLSLKPSDRYGSFLGYALSTVDRRAWFGSSEVWA